MRQTQVKAVRRKVRQLTSKVQLDTIRQIQALDLKQRWWFAKKILFLGDLKN